MSIIRQELVRILQKVDDMMDKWLIFVAEDMDSHV